MIVLENINKSFHNKVIFENANFCAEKGEITLIYGESGCGKTTLLDLIVKKVKGDHRYFYNQKEIEDIDDFIHQQIAYTTQTPKFVASLTIEDNIRLLCELNAVTYDKEKIKEYAELLMTVNLLNKYPKSLSGGEQRRVAIIAQLMLDKEIILMDEPSASLDKENQYRLIELLQMLKKNEKIIIVVSHDLKLKEMADKVYKIENQSLILEKENTEEIIRYDDEWKRKKELIKTNRILKIIQNKYKYHKLQTILANLFLFATIVFLGFSFSFGNSYLKMYETELSKMSSNELIVYEALAKAEEFGDDYMHSAQYPFSDENYEKLKKECKKENVKITPFYDFSTPDVYGSPNYDTLSVIDNSGNEEVFTFYHEELGLSFTNTVEGYDYSSRVLESYHNEGIYIPKLFADRIGIDKSHSTIKFNLPVPQYNIVPGGYFTNAEGYSVTTAAVKCKMEEITIKIAGVYDGYSLGVSYNSPANGDVKIYIPYELYAQLTMQNMPTEPTTNKEVVLGDQVLTPWIPGAYLLSGEGENIANMMQFLDEHEIAYVNQYYDTQKTIDSVERMTSIYSKFALVIFAGVCIILFVLEFVRKKEEMQLYSICIENGMKRSQYISIKMLSGVFKSLCMAILTIVALYLIISFANANSEYTTVFSMTSVVAVCVFSLMSCVVIPFVAFYLGRHND